MSNLFSSELQRINRYNFDDLLKVVTEWNEPEQVRRDLLAIYFHAVQAIFNDGCSIGTLADSFSTLQEIIEALDTVGNVKDAKFAVINK